MALKNPLRGAYIPPELQERFREERLASNISRMRGFSVYIIVLQVLLNVINMVVPQSGVVGNVPGMPVPLDWYVGLSIIALLCGIIYFILLSRARAGAIASRALKVFLVHSLLYIYAVIQVLFLSMNMLSNQGFGSYVIFILMLAIIPLLSWRQSVTTLVALFVYLLAFTFATQNLSGEAVSPFTGESYAWRVTTFSELLYTDWRSNLLSITVASAFISMVAHFMYASNFLKGIQLVEQNALLEQRVAERTAELVEKTKAAEEASRASSRFLVSVSHEVRTPLNAIMGMTHVARKSEDLAKIARALEQIESSSTLLFELLNDVLDMSSIEAGQLHIEHKRFALRRFLQEVVHSSSARAAQKGITLKTNIAELDDYLLIGDRLRLAQVLLNLLDNAVKFSAEDSTIGLRVLVQEEGEQKEDPLTVSFVVFDKGIGMDADTLSHLFMPFEQGSTEGMKHAGLGLGLTVSQSLVEMMGGHIEVQSEEGKGSTFSFSLQFERAEQVKVDSVPIPDLTGYHILSVEDIAINRDILRELTEDTHVTIEEAYDGVEAVERFAASPEGHYALVFMDLLMPRLDGYKAAAHIRALMRSDAKTVPIVALSANAYPDDVRRSLAAGMNAHIAKPVSFETLMSALNTYIAK